MISSKSCKWQKGGSVLSEQKKAYPSNDARQSGLINSTETKKKMWVLTLTKLCMQKQGQYEMKES